jgi:hypothetical protein
MTRLSLDHVQVIENGFTVPRAMQISQAACTEQALYGRVAHWRERERFRPREGAVVNILDNQGTLSSVSLMSAGSTNDKSSKDQGRGAF